MRPRVAWAAAALALHAPGVRANQATGERPAVTEDRTTAATPTIDTDGTVHYAPNIVVPFSPLASAQARAAAADRSPVVPPDYFVGNPYAPERIAATRAWFAENANVLIEQMRHAYPVNVVASEIGGVRTAVVTPHSGGLRHADRVLINLHGGGFVFGTELGLVEAIPIASVGRIKVVTVDYRMGPEYHFPAASEDVAKVYAALLEHYAPGNIGIFGCSAGGTLTMQAVAWFQTHGLPRPGAIAVACAGGIGSPTAFPPGDSRYTSRLFSGAPMPRPGAAVPASLMQYYREDDLVRPTASPALFPAVLAKFPPTLMLTGTRDFALSNAVWTHSQLVKQKVDADLHVWEGVGHGFMYRQELPESREAYDVVAAFFERTLGSGHRR